MRILINQPGGKYLLKHENLKALMRIRMRICSNEMGILSMKLLKVVKGPLSILSVKIFTRKKNYSIWFRTRYYEIWTLTPLLITQ